MAKQKILSSPTGASGVGRGKAADVAGDAKRKMESIFDQSLAVLCTGHIPEHPPAEVLQRVLEKQPRKAKAIPLSSYSNSLPIHIDNVSLQRRALVDAAKALATLWKVPETTGSRLRGSGLHRSRLQNRGLQFSRETS